MHDLTFQQNKKICFKDKLNRNLKEVVFFLFLSDVEKLFTYKQRSFFGGILLCICQLIEENLFLASVNVYQMQADIAAFKSLLTVSQDHIIK